MTSEQFWGLQHRYDPHTDRFHFSPTGLNPPSNSPSRPDIRWQEREPEHPTLLPDAPKDRVSQPLFRGLAINLNDPRAADIHRLVFGEHPGDAYMFNHPRRDPNWEHPELSRTILDYLENSGHQRETGGSVYGLGPHWSVNPSTANEFAFSESLNLLRDPNGLHLPVRLTGQWRGLGEDPYRSHTLENYPGEHGGEGEVTLLPAAGMNITDVRIHHPQKRNWVSLPHTPHFRHAAATPMPVRPRTAKRILTQRELLEG